MERKGARMAVVVQEVFGATDAEAVRVSGVNPKPVRLVDDPTSFVSGCISAAMTAQVSTLLLAAPGAGKRNYITTLIVSNSHLTVDTELLIQDGNDGPTIAVVPAAKAFGGAAIPFPIPLPQPTVNTAIYVKNTVNGAAVKVTGVGYKAA